MRQTVVLNLLIINRVHTSEECIKRILQFSPRDKFIWVVTDQNSNDETKSMLRKYEKEFDDLMWNDFNMGCSIGINRGMAKAAEYGIDFLDINADWLLYSEWFDIFTSISKDEDIGVVAGRRAEFWGDRPEKWSMLRSGIVIPEKRHGVWCELVTNGLIIGPFWYITNKVIDQVGFMNEADLLDDIDFYHRVQRTGLKSLYCLDVLAKQPQDEIQDHPQYGSHKALLSKTTPIFQKYLMKYLKGQLYCGTRWLPHTMQDAEYKRESDYNWNWLKNWPMSDMPH